MTGKVDFGTLGQEPLATFLTAARQRLAPTLAAHARAKSMLLLARPLGWLIRAFGHKTRM